MKKEFDVVGAVIKDKSGKIFCALRSENMTLPNLWEFPGGKIEKGEQAEESLVREIWEELGCRVKVKNHICSNTHEYEMVIVHFSTFEVEILEGQPVLHEHASSIWLAPQNLKSLVWAEADIPTVELLMRETKK
ncbi:(deoxy)nucleoside triphosphate pyrophosphohydrolase [Sediminitomix flava]|uniref:8-oxo-dGTP diphosphatase n=1 Tax=Sediminitomix flava TaxID=379075 RepID=A0A315YWD4_SEDFL|nr:(deoxy)nucleoside triphosphate pyrophosphohydrolase [Sediminitomix flava]PWJ34094.1 8-oxo-dGTP diphosphatase [Sediminitomix flava]